MKIHVNCTRSKTALAARDHAGQHGTDLCLGSRKTLRVCCGDMERNLDRTARSRTANAQPSITPPGERQYRLCSRFPHDAQLISSELKRRWRCHNTA